mmetsp:Transcript_39606/g.109102  ORF Transcript_39606/g.109102 Transcript_39606/m.109102 type:complete len:427 (-) Transcript_39606:68-1348(-)
MASPSIGVADDNGVGAESAEELSELLHPLIAEDGRASARSVALLTSVLVVAAFCAIVLRTAAIPWHARLRSGSLQGERIAFNAEAVVNDLADVKMSSTFPPWASVLSKASSTLPLSSTTLLSDSGVALQTAEPLHSASTLPPWAAKLLNESGASGGFGTTPTPCSRPWAQCGGRQWQGPTCCPAGYECSDHVSWYSQCKPIEGEASNLPSAMRRFGSGRPKILCYGDSMTAGFYNSGLQFSPYGETLAKRLPATVWVNGLSGYTATLMARSVSEKGLVDLTRHVGWGVKRILREKGPFDLMLIMAGTNDLLRGHSPDSAFEAVKALHTACHNMGVRTVALSVPPGWRGMGEQDYAARWSRLNRLIRRWCGEGKVAFVDVAKLVPYGKHNGFWAEDGIHFTPRGSELLATKLDPILRPFLEADDPGV